MNSNDADIEEGDFFEYQSAILGRKGGIYKFLEID